MGAEGAAGRPRVAPGRDTRRRAPSRGGWLRWPGEFHGLYSPWGRKESDMTEHLSLHCKPKSLEPGTEEVVVNTG